MHERTIKEFSHLVVHLCILAAMIDVCLCSNVYSPLTSRPQIWSTRERGELFQRYDVHMWSVSTHELSKLRDVSYSLYVFVLTLSSKGQVLWTYNFMMKNVLIAFHFQWKIVLSICELSSQGDGIHIQWYSFILFTLLVFFYFVLEKTT